MTERTPQSVPHREIREPLGILHDYAMLATGVVVSRRNEALAAENEIIERYARLEEQLEVLRNGCEQALLLLERERFLADPECKVVRAVLRSAIDSSPAKRPT